MEDFLALLAPWRERVVATPSRTKFPETYRRNPMNPLTAVLALDNRARLGQSARVSDEAEVIERERRQLVLMQERVAGFRSSDVSLGSLIADLEGLLEARALASEQWVDDFRSAWGDLEISYAVALDRLTPIPDTHDPGVGDALFDLDALIFSALADLG